MNYHAQIENSRRACHQALLELRCAEAARNDLIREAHHHGGFTTRGIAEASGLTFQRVAEIIAGDPDRRGRPTLHGAMQQVLTEAGNPWMRAHEIARAVYERELYRRKDRSVIQPGQVRARAAAYPDMFEGSRDGSNRIRLRSQA